MLMKQLICCFTIGISLFLRPIQATHFPPPAHQNLLPPDSVYTVERPRSHECFSITTDPHHLVDSDGAVCDPTLVSLERRRRRRAKASDVGGSRALAISRGGWDGAGFNVAEKGQQITDWLSEIYSIGCCPRAVNKTEAYSHLLAKKSETTGVADESFAFPPQPPLSVPSRIAAYFPRCSSSFSDARKTGTANNALRECFARHYLCVACCMKTALREEVLKGVQGYRSERKSGGADGDNEKKSAPPLPTPIRGIHFHECVTSCRHSGKDTIEQNTFKTARHHCFG